MSPALWANDTIDTATGVGIVIYQASRPGNCIRDSVLVDFGLSYFSISLSLNILLTLMIVIRLVLHIRNIRTVMEAPSGFTGLYKTIVTMLIESSAIYAASSLLFLGFWGSGSYVADMFSEIQAETQVRAFFPSTRRSSNTVVLCDQRSSLHCSSFNESPIRGR